MAALPEELERLCVEWGFPAYRGRQILEWLHRKRVTDWDGMTSLPIALREHLAALGPALPVGAGQVLRSLDGTRKLQVVLADGQAVETVLIPEGTRLTQCISTQVGCAVRCAFCRSGCDGLTRNLTAAEIVGQVHLAAAEYLPGESLRNVVLMGVGEPLHNLERVLRVLAVLGHPQGLDLSTRRVTVSTVGVPAGIDRLGQATGGAAALAISLHAADDRTRARLVPGVKAPLAEIVAALERYPLPKRRRFTIEYVLVDGVNDRPEDARALVRLLSKLRVKVNLLPLNPHDRTDLRPPPEERVLAFQQVLTDKGLSAFLRRRRGADIGAACGQLVCTARLP
ncbi:MAG TPA: 23S rRNA (adenine(2503)-C(2))-methyltransferase RlmN [Phycisphaerae bacterium]|nr:23S rRNA (adenine(2503)-C(2))-methyltransferase RlmN [Phycisphaerae bacterium]